MTPKIEMPILNVTTSASLLEGLLLTAVTALVVADPDSRDATVAAPAKCLLKVGSVYYKIIKPV